MATIILQAAGAFLGGFLGPAGAAIGSAAGAMAGYALDRSLIQSTQRFEGPRLAAARPFTAEEGAPIPRVYGTARIGGTLIWATRFEESRQTERQGAKGGPKVTTYSYSANAGFALCEGKIAGIRRVWADGRELDLERIELRVHTGADGQLLDPLVEAKQGSGNAPAYRGTAYVVLEKLPLEDFGNRIPQLQFEVLRPLGDLDGRIRAVALIPGSTEYGLSPDPVTLTPREGETILVNRHVLHAGTDIAASLDELQMLCPNLEHVALVATWFGDDLRAASCQIRPGVTQTDDPGFSQAWTVSGVARQNAFQVSRHGGGSAYGGTPSDRSVLDAIAVIKARGLKVTLYPFVMMDIAAGNGLPDPYGGAQQAAYPWRGRITGEIAPGLPGTTDKTAEARNEVEAFSGGAMPGDFAAATETIVFSGNPGDWGYRRLVLHYAYLAAAAGGVDAFLLGSELRGLTTLRDAANAFPFVEQLGALAGEVRDVLGVGTEITYGADWSEYFGHQPADGSGDVFFHLDDLWAHPAVTAVGIDNYMPLSDWRDGDYGGGNPDGFDAPYDAARLREAIAGGEGFDWYYASESARKSRQRTAIADGAYEKHWVFRNKDIFGWWSNVHHNRIGGVEAASPTAWVPQSKPVWFTELGCPAVDKGPNQPNVFPDPKSSEAAVPRFSSGGRSDLAQRRFLGAHFDHWLPSEGLEEAQNPLSTLYGGRMVEPSRIYLWAWDARPFPAFPLRQDVWSDGTNWLTGHWLNGRLGGVEAGDLINAILAEHGLPPADVRQADGTVHGYVIDDPTTARAAIEPVCDLFGLSVREEAGVLHVATAGAQAAGPLEVTALVSDEDRPAVEMVRTASHDLPVEAQLLFRDPFADYQQAVARQTHPGGAGSRQEAIGFPGMLETGEGEALLAGWLQRVWQGRERISFSVAAADRALGPGKIFRLPAVSGQAEYAVTGIEEGLARQVSARRIERQPPFAQQMRLPGPPIASTAVAGRPLALFLDLPMTPGAQGPEDQLRVAVWAKPWRTQALFASPEETGFAQRATIARRAVIGRLVEPLGSGREGRIDAGASILAELFGGEVSSVSRSQMLNGANAIAIQSLGGAWEIAQFETAEETGPGLWRLSGLLRGQLGTGDVMAAGAAAGAYLVLLDDAVTPAGLKSAEAGIALNWRTGPTGYDFTSANFNAQSVTGGVRALIPLSPVHLRARKNEAGDIALSWIRRGRIDADGWLSTEIPLGEEEERYRIDILTTGGAMVRTAEAAAPTWTYAAANIAADFPAPGSETDIAVRQMSAAVGPGLATVSRITIS